MLPHTESATNKTKTAYASKYSTWCHTSLFLSLLDGMGLADDVNFRLSIVGGEKTVTS